MVAAVRDMVDTFGFMGGAYSSVMADNAEDEWDGIMELYYYSREFYDREQGRADCR
jgi:hypothetical protein